MTSVLPFRWNSIFLIANRPEVSILWQLTAHIPAIYSRMANNPENTLKILFQKLCGVCRTIRESVGDPGMKYMAICVFSDTDRQIQVSSDCHWGMDIPIAGFHHLV